MEQKILGALGFSIITPTIHTFLERFLKIAEAEQHSYRVGENADIINDTIFALGRVRNVSSLMQNHHFNTFLSTVFV
jgi:hypothetical protein